MPSNTHSFHPAVRNQALWSSTPLVFWKMAQCCPDSIARKYWDSYISVFFLPFIFTYFSHVYSSNPQHHQPSCLLSSFILSILPSLLYFQFISNSVSLCLSFYFSPLPSLIISLPLFPFNKCQAPRHPCEVENTLTTKVDTVSILSGLHVSCLFTETDIEKHCNCGEV